VSWPADAALRLRADGGAWPGLEAGHGLLAERAVCVHVEGRGEARRPRTGATAAEAVAEPLAVAVAEPLAVAG
jgi:hypothetical protein